jgi:hypothetical protein
MGSQCETCLKPQDYVCNRADCVTAVIGGEFVSPSWTHNMNSLSVILVGCLSFRIESMNSVMDDNRLLTLPSNERIRLLPHMKMIFEIRDLKYATPATATRAGILYISEGLQWRNMMHSNLRRVVGYAQKLRVHITIHSSSFLTNQGSLLPQSIQLSIASSPELVLGL